MRLIYNGPIGSLPSTVRSAADATGLATMVIHTVMTTKGTRETCDWRGAEHGIESQNDRGLSMAESTHKLCFDCKYRERVMGSSHSRCRHPSAAKTNRGELLAMLAGSVFIELESARELDIQAKAHGVRNGWFNWPYDFDPVWLENCNGFDMKEAEQSHD